MDFWVWLWRFLFSYFFLFPLWHFHSFSSRLWWYFFSRFMSDIRTMWPIVSGFLLFIFCIPCFLYRFFHQVFSFPFWYLYFFFHFFLLGLRIFGKNDLNMILWFSIILPYCLVGFTRFIPCFSYDGGQVFFSWFHRVFSVSQSSFFSHISAFVKPSFSFSYVF